MSVVLPGPLVTVDWLVRHRSTIDAGEVIVADVRWSPTAGPDRDAYERSHIPGAVFVDLDTDLAAPAYEGSGRHPFPSAGDFAMAMGRLGIGDDTPVIAYDDVHGSIAARLWWMLHIIGHPVAVLDGGLTAWTGERDTGDERRRTRPFTVRPWPADRLLDADDVELVRHDEHQLLIDARAGERFAGAAHPLDPLPGHIPGARSAPWAGNVDADGRFLDPGALRQRFEQLDATSVDRVVASCGSGVTACQDLLALEAAGITDTALFVGSWSAWSTDPRRPIATGPD